MEGHFHFNSIWNDFSGYWHVNQTKITVVVIVQGFIPDYNGFVPKAIPSLICPQT